MRTGQAADEAYLAGRIYVNSESFLPCQHGGRSMATAIYMSVSSNRQETKSQETDLSAHRSAVEARGEQVPVFREKATRMNYDRFA
jgi:hypothetical protein